MKLSELFESEITTDLLEMFALIETDSGDVTELSEASRRKAALIGLAAGGIGGAILGSTLARGKQRDLQAQLDRGKKKLQKWKQEPEKHKEKIQRLEDKMRKWSNHLQHLRDTGQGDAGGLRSSYEKSQKKKELKRRMKEEK